MRTRVFGIFMFALLTLASSDGFGQAPEAGTPPASAAQSRIVGVVTAVDQGGNQLTIKSDAGESIAVVTNATSAVLRLPPGETSAQRAVKITLADIAVGDRVFARGTTSADGKSVEARQVVVTGAAVASGATVDQQRQGEDFRQRGLFGRIAALDPTRKEISVQSRGRDTAPVAVVVTDATRFFRYAPDSMDIKNASRSSFAEFKVGDQLRALGNRSEDGTRFTADEIIAGSMARTAGQVVAVNAGANELTIKNSQGETVTVAIGSRSSLRRVTPEAAAAFEASRPTRQAGAGRTRQDGEAGQAGQEGRRRERRERSASEGGEPRRPRAGRGFQEMLEGLPAITINDLKKGDTVFVSGSEGASPARLTAIMLVTGDPAFMVRFMQTGPNRGPQSPGLPGDVMGGGVGNPERPPNP